MGSEVRHPIALAPRDEYLADLIRHAIRRALAGPSTPACTSELTPYR